MLGAGEGEGAACGGLSFDAERAKCAIGDDGAAGGCL